MARAETKRELLRVTVATVRTMADAQRIKAVLDGEKIESFVANEGVVATSHSAKRELVAMVIQVDRRLAARAVAVLRAHSNRGRTETVAPTVIGRSRGEKASGAARIAIPAAAALALGLGLIWLLLN